MISNYDLDVHTDRHEGKMVVDDHEREMAVDEECNVCDHGQLILVAFSHRVSQMSSCFVIARDPSIITLHPVITQISQQYV